MEIQYRSLFKPNSDHPLLVFGLFFGILVPLVLFGRLAEHLRRRGAFRHEARVLRFIHQFASPPLDRLVVTVAHWGSAWVILTLTLAIALLLLWYKGRRPATFLLLAVGGSAFLNVGAKAVYQRSRPALWLSPAPELDYGFPSGHAMLTMALGVALGLLVWRTRWRWPVCILGGAFVLVIGLSRLYLEVHFPSDILAGWSLTMAWVVGLFYILHRPHLDAGLPSGLGARAAAKPAP